MTFAKIISEAGLNPTDYPKLSETMVTVSDQEGRELKEDEVNFAIFSENDNALTHFKVLLNHYENTSANYGVTSATKTASIRIFEDSLLIRFDSQLHILPW